MLELINIKKDYPAGNGVVHALKGVSLCFRESEFVSILGQSGCGKTTMLNIIGGLDKYTEGDLIINGVSTKKYKDRNWDMYRNHSIGFVFQSYNLIPHQTVLANVELTLTLSGVPKKERRERAVKALEQVGLGDQLKKKPGEMSGGQMQRVAIARALVNNPDIILADEPTGALDSETSIQVMEILKSISKNRLIIMVTHNPELAEKYSSRIIKMLDGEVTDDSKPLSKEEIEKAKKIDEEKSSEKPKKLPSMSFGTSFALSLKNLFTKKGRTLLTSFAGSIGIIGIALILSISKGTTRYIDTVQEETLAIYPLTIERTSMNLNSIMNAFMDTDQERYCHENDKVYDKSSIYEMANALSNLESYDNDMASFKQFIEEQYADENSVTGLNEALSGVQYTYDLNVGIYTKNQDGEIIESDVRKLLAEIIMKNMGIDFDNMTNFGGNTENSTSVMSMASSSQLLMQEMLPGLDGEIISPTIKEQYEIVYGTWPTAYNEVVLVIDENNEVDDLSLYAMGLLDEEYINNMTRQTMNGESVDFVPQSYSYEEICGLEFSIVLPSQCYSYDTEKDIYIDLRETEAGLQYLYDNGISIKVVGIIKPDKYATTVMLSSRSPIAYTSLLTEYAITNAADSDVLNAQKANPETDVLNGFPFRETVENMTAAEKKEEVKDYFLSLSEEEKAVEYINIMCSVSDEELEVMVEDYIDQVGMENLLEMMSRTLSEEVGISIEEINSYISSMTEEELRKILKQTLAEQILEEYQSGIVMELSQYSTADLAGMFEATVSEYSEEECADIYETVMEISDSSYEENLRLLGNVSLDNPYTINLYAATFNDKDTIKDAIAYYNSTKDELSEIKYTDYVGIIMSSVTTIINAIAYVLIAFVAISLIVSSIMIGVITLISVQERTKEIGILRAIGASKRDVAGLFNAETIIIGFTSGVLGVIITYILCFPVNKIVHSLTGIGLLSAYLPWMAGVVLVIISLLLTLIAGIIPSASAAKKDPVVALRSE